MPASIRLWHGGAMHTELIVGLVLGAVLLVVSAVVTVVAILRAPEAYENHDGFHRLDDRSPEALAQQREKDRATGTRRPPSPALPVL